MKDIIDLLGEVETGKPKSQRKYDRNVMRFVRPTTDHYKVSFRECADRLVHLEYIFFPEHPDFLVLTETNIIPPAHVSKLAYIFSAVGNKLLVRKCEDRYWNKDNPYLLKTDYPYILLPELTETPAEWEYELSDNVHVHCSSLVSVRYDRGIKRETLYVLRDISCKYEQLFRRMTTLECYVAGFGLQDFVTQADE